MTRAKKFAVVAVFAPVLLGGCTDWAGYDLDYIWGEVPALASLRTSVAFDPYEAPRLPPEHSVPIAGEYGFAPAPFTSARLDSVAATLVNPFAGGAPPEVLARGETVYANQCAVCHGPTGDGDGTVIGAGRFPFSVPVNSGAAVSRSDGYLYGVVAVGRGLMPPYGEKLNHGDRWAVVEYVRELQRGAGAAPAAPMPAPVTVPEAAADQSVAAPDADAAGADAPVEP